VVLVLAVTSCGGGRDRRASRSVAPAPAVVESLALPRGLAIGLTEFDPALIAPVGDRARGGPAARAARRLARIRPRVLRLMVLWSAVQPRRARAPDWDAPAIGGHSVRAQLRALVQARRAAGGGFEPLVVLYSTPAWAASRRRGCEPRGANVNARAPDRSALPAYRRLVRSLLALGRREGVELRLWSAWNEPNSGLFLSPQRARCDASAPSLGPRLYAPLARALGAELAAAPGEQGLVVGETSSPFLARPRITGTAEFVRGLPQDVACAGGVWAQHQYVGDADRLGELRRALDARRCSGGVRRIWITETGVGGRSSGRERDTDPAVLRAGCRALHAVLERWRRDPGIDAAIQYTFREDPGFPVGLASADLRRTYPAYGVWRAWGGDRDPRGAGPPRPPAGCR